MNVVILKRGLALVVLLVLLLPGIQIFSAPEISPQTALTPNISRAGVPDMEANISYAIITDYRYTPYLQELKRMKTEKGVKTEIYELNGSQGIIDNYRYKGIDDAQRIHEFLRDLEALNPELEWVLLVGDHEIIPARKLYLNGSISTNYQDVDGCGFDQYCYSDYYYAGLDSTWNSNPDQKPVIWGEEGETDWTANVYVGRLPVSTPEEAQRTIQNILDYELNPPAGYWYNSHLICAGLMDRPNILDNPGTSGDEGYNSYKDNSYEIATKIEQHIPEHMTSYMLYDYNKIEGGDYSPFYDTLNHSNANKYWNLGNSLVTFASHGYSDGDALLHYMGDGDMAYDTHILPFFDYEDATNCKNGGMLPLVYGSACGVGNFTEPDDTNMERLMYAKSGGAIGVIMASSRSTYRCEFEENDSSYGNWWLLDEFWRLFFEEDMYQPGKALYESKANYGDRIIDPLNPHKEYPYKTLYKTNRAAYNLLGCPEVPIWTDIPRQLIVEYPKPMYINNNSLTVTVKSPGGQPVENALVCLITGDLYTTGRTEANGSLTFTLDLNETTTINMTITAHNFLRWTGKLDVVSVIDVKYDKNSFGHSVEYPKEGDTIMIYVNITNIGEVPVDDLTVEFFQNTVEDVNMVKRFSALSLAAKESKLKLFKWEVLAGTTKLYVSVDPDNKYFEYNEDNNLGYIEIKANKPVTFLSPPDMLMYEDTQLIDNLSATENLFIYAKDTDGPNPLRLSILNVSVPECNCSLVELADDDIRLNVKPPPDWFGSLEVVIQCSDGPTTATTDITVNVENVPDPPEFLPVDIAYVNESEVFYWSTWVKDIDSLSLNFSCSSETLDIGWGQADAKKVYITFIANNSLVGEHTVTLSAWDESDLYAEMEMTVQVINVNTGPTITEPDDDQTYDLKVNEEFLLYVRAKDADKGDTLTYIDDSYMFEINESSGAILFTPESRDVGTHTVTVWVLDENGTQDKINITFIVTEDKFEGDSYTVLIIFIACVVLIVTLSLAFQAWRKDKRHDVASSTDADDEGGQVRQEPVSIREWASRDRHVEDLVEEYSKNDLKRLKQPRTRSLKKGEPVPKLPPARLKRKRKKRN